MACPGGCGKTIQGQCDCCLNIRSDKSFKEVVKCEKCNAYICKECMNNPFVRMAAYTLRFLGMDVRAVVENKCKDC